MHMLVVRITEGNSPFAPVYVLLLGLYLLITFYLYIIGNIADTELRKDIFFGNRKY